MMLHNKGYEHPDFRVFDYSYVIGAGNNTRRINQTVFFVHSKELNLPQLLMKPEHFFHRIGEWLGMQDIDFEEYPKFSRQYLLQGEDEEWIRASMPDELLRFFTIEKKWTLEGLNYYLIFYRRNRLLPPKQVRQFYHRGLETCKMLAKAQP